LARSAQPLKAWLSPESLQPRQSFRGSVPARHWWPNAGSAELVRSAQPLKSWLSPESLQPPQSFRGSVPARLWWPNAGLQNWCDRRNH
jgi:hypothetical protein